MLTVKHVEPTGHESIMTTPRIGYQPAIKERKQPEIVFVEREGRPVFEIVSGSVYVMNDKGSTVSVY